LINSASHLWGKITPKPQKWGVNGDFQAKLQRKLNFDIVRTAKPIQTIFCIVIKTTSTHHVWSTARVQQIQNGGWPPPPTIVGIRKVE